MDEDAEMLAAPSSPIIVDKKKAPNKRAKKAQVEAEAAESGEEDFGQALEDIGQQRDADDDMIDDDPPPPARTEKLKDVKIKIKAKVGIPVSPLPSLLGSRLLTLDNLNQKTAMPAETGIETEDIEEEEQIAVQEKPKPKPRLRKAPAVDDSVASLAKVSIPVFPSR